MQDCEITKSYIESTNIVCIFIKIYFTRAHSHDIIFARNSSLEIRRLHQNVIPNEWSIKGVFWHIIDGTAVFNWPIHHNTVKIYQKLDYVNHLRETSQILASFFIEFPLITRIELHESGSRMFMMTSSNGNIFRVTGHLCRWIPRTKASDASFDVFFDLRLITRPSKQSQGWWFETPSCPLWLHCNGHISFIDIEFEHAIYLLRRVSAFRWATLYHATYPSSDEHANKLSDYPKGKHLTLNYRINGVPTIVISIWFITA